MEEPLILIGKAARRAALKYRAGSKLQKRLAEEGASKTQVEKAVAELALALRAK